MTAIAEQFARGGIHPRDAELDIAIAKYINSGGTIARALDRLNAAAARMSGMGQTGNAVGSQASLTQTRQRIEGGEAVVGAPQVHSTLAQSSSSNHDIAALAIAGIPSLAPLVPSRRVPDRGGDGRVAHDTLVQRDIATPAREPTFQQRMISARNAHIVAITIMDTLKIDGRPIGDWTVAEARQAGRLKTREGHILIAASRMVANAAGNELLREVVKPAEMQKIIQKAAEAADAV
jgi:hypothetical protein